MQKRTIRNVQANRALTIGARLIGVDHRDLHTFTIDINNSIRYRQSVPEDVLFVSESGIENKGRYPAAYGAQCQWRADRGDDDACR